MLIYFIQTYLSYTKLSASNFKPEKSIMGQNDEVKHVTLMGVKCLLLITQLIKFQHIIPLRLASNMLKTLENV